MKFVLYITIPLLLFLVAKGDILLPLQGNVYPDGVYNAVLRIGTKSFEFHVDTGSDVSWVQCQDVEECIGCTMKPVDLYKPHDNYFPKTETLCKTIRGGSKDKDPGPSCTFTIEYGENSIVEGVAVRDKMASGTNDMGDLVFGCANKLTHSDSTLPDGLLGLGNSPASIVEQLNSQGVTPTKVFGHCLGMKNGYLFIGENSVPTSDVTWAGISTRVMHKPVFTSTQGELFYDQQSTGYKDLLVSFDSGRTFTSFLSEPYAAMKQFVDKNIEDGNILEVDPKGPEHHVFEVCWKRKDNHPIKSIEEIKTSFKPLKLIFKQSKYKNPSFEIPPEAYLVVIETGSVCFGIWPDDQNIIGAISMQNQLFIYHKTGNKIGWKSQECNGNHEFLEISSHSQQNKNKTQSS